MSGGDIVRIAQEVSPEAADRLMRAFGGGVVYLPRRPGPEHPISRAIGLATAREIAEALGPGRLQVPRGTRAAQEEKASRIVAMIRARRPVAEIVRTVGCDARTVYRWRRRLSEAAE